MKKLIAALDGLQFSESTLQYSVWAARTFGFHIVAVFLDDVLYHSYKVTELLGDNGGISEEKRKKLEAKDAGKRQVAVTRFKTVCENAGVSYSIHHDRNVALQELLQESIYADLLVIDRKETLTHYQEKIPTRFVRDLLSEVQCPVLLVPSKFKQPGGITFLYDGGPSSVHATKMFSYLFPDPKYPATETVSVKPVNQTVLIPNKHLMKEFMSRHFPAMRLIGIKGFAETEIPVYLKKKKTNPIVVLGAYRRSRVSRWFSPSMADALMKQLQVPLFIAHNK